MAWYWSHLAKGIQNVRDNLRFKSLDFLGEAAEAFGISYAEGCPRDILEECIFEKMAELALCDNGGFDAWASPDGSLKVSFSSPMDLAREAAANDELRLWYNGMNRYTVVFIDGRIIIMSGLPFHPQGLCQHGSGAEFDVDVVPDLETGNLLSVYGAQIEFDDLPEDCQKAVARDFEDEV